MEKGILFMKPVTDKEEGSKKYSFGEIQPSKYWTGKEFGYVDYNEARKIDNFVKEIIKEI